MSAATWLVISEPTPDPDQPAQHEHQDHARRDRRDLMEQWGERAAFRHDGDAAADDGRREDDDREPETGQRCEEELADHHPRTPWRDEEGGGDRLVPELGGDDQHAEEECEQVPDEAPPDEVAQLLDGVGDGRGRRAEGRAHAVVAPHVAVVDEVDDDQEPGDHDGDAAEHPGDRGGAELQPLGADEGGHESPPWTAT